MKLRYGFTLVELLVVISIIGILSAVIFGSFSGARGEARNKALQTELKQVQLAVEVYKAQYGRYPGVDVASQPACGAGLIARQGGTCPNFINYIGEATVGYLAPEFIAELPLASDSKNPICLITYETDANGSWYKLSAVNCYENATQASEGIGEDKEFSRCPSSCGTCGGSTYDETVASFYETMAVYSFGGECE